MSLMYNIHVRIHRLIEILDRSGIGYMHRYTGRIYVQARVLRASGGFKPTRTLGPSRPPTWVVTHVMGAELLVAKES